MSLQHHETDDLQEALAAAEQMRAEGRDTHHVAKWLRHYHRRCRELDQLLMLTDRFLRFGMPEHELSAMRRLVDRLREDGQADIRGEAVDSPLPL